MASCFSNMTTMTTAGAAMKWAIGLFLLAMLGTAGTAVGLAAWTGHFVHHDANLRAIHYDTDYDLSAQRRLPVE
jgi:hypothetical protein